jgi:subtilase family serine protease
LRTDGDGQKMRTRRRTFSVRPRCDWLDDRCLLSNFSPTQPSGYTPAQITAAYGLNAITFTSSSGAAVKGDGTGETIALIEMYHDPNLQSDLATFDSMYNLPNPSLSVVNQAGGQTNSGWAQEESLDVEWAHAIAPGASIVVVEAAPSYSQSQELANLLGAVNTARSTPGVVAISMSWGFNEMPNEASYDSTFTTPAGHTGITFIAAAGDSGGVEYPSASPNVLSVGGTTLNMSSSGGYGSETAWSSTGGGYSQFELEPEYQEAVQQTGARATPDVAFDGDPNTGVEVYSTPPGSTRGSWQVFGGTSVGAPSWAGLIAIVDQGRAVAGQASLDGPTQTLPALYAAAAANFHSVAATPEPTFGGFGGFDPFGGGFFGELPSWSAFGSGFEFGYGVLSGSGSTGQTTAGATANTATGLGSPNGSALVPDLVSTTVAAPLTTSGPSGQSTSGTTAPTTPTTPTTPTGKHHAKRHHEIKKTAAHPASTHARGLANQHHAAVKKATTRIKRT